MKKNKNIQLEEQLRDERPANSSRIWMYLFFTVVGLLTIQALYRNYYRIKQAIDKPNLSKQNSTQEKGNSNPSQDSDPRKDLTPKIEDRSKAIPHIITPARPILGEGFSWQVIGASVIGKGHIEQNLPCQDNHYYETLENGWGIAVVADGAGSAKHSDKGSKLVASQIVPKVFIEELLKKEDWIQRDYWPSEKNWNQKAVQYLKMVYDALIYTSRESNYIPKDLACTLIM